MRISIALLFIGICTGQERPGVVLVETGALRGAQQARTYAFLNVPYAAPPTGALRLRPPQPPFPWNGERDATAWGPVCPQFSADKKIVGSEDCLQLNVWTPVARAETPRPVMFWIPGGGHVVGGAPMEQAGGYIYDGSRLSERTGAVVVTINYRLGPLGWLAHPLLTRESEPHTSGNFGTLDQIAALEWVRRNIAAFGGDPQRVMIFGESAGGVSACSLIASPLATGLFTRAAIQSGGCPARGLAENESFGRRVVEAAGCADHDDPLACLRAMPVNRLLAALPVEIDVAGAMAEYGSTVDGYVLKGMPLEVIAAGEHNAVPLIVGANKDETSRTVPPGITTVAAYEAAVRRLFPLPALANRVLAEYPVSEYSSPRAAYVALTSDMKFICPSRTVTRTFVAGQREPVFRYFLTRGFENGGPLLASFGAWHGADILYLFDTMSTLGAYAPSDTERHIGEAMMSYWSNLAMQGDPSGPGLAFWPRAAGGFDRYFQFDGALQSGEGVRTRQCDFWDEMGRLLR